MNRFLRGRRATPWAWMQTGPLTVDAERLAAVAAEQIPAVAQSERANLPTEQPCHETDVAERAESHWPQRQGTALAVPQDIELSGVSTPEVSIIESPEMTLDDLPAFKAAMESLEKRGDPIFVSDDAELLDTQPAPKRRRAKPIRKHKQIALRANLRPAPLRKQSRPKNHAEIDESHHERRCTICRHPEREAIEEAFLQWRNVRFLVREFHVTGGPSAVYRHARALKLFKQRNLCLRSSLEFVIEQSERIIPTAEGLVKAIRAYTRINDAGEWIDSPTTHIVQVMAMPSADDRNCGNVVPGLTLDVRKERSQIIESAVRQPLLTGTPPQTENGVTG